MNEIKQFTFLENYFEIIEELNDEKKKEILFDIYNYMYKNIEPSFEEKDTKKLAWLGLITSLNTSKNRAWNNKNKNKSNKSQKEVKVKSNKKQKENKLPSTSTSNTLEDKSMREETFKKIKDEFNEVGLSKITILSKSRKDKLKLRIKEFGEKMILDTIKKISSSKFLMGDNKQNWKCSFDWLIENDKNILKVYEGNYDSEKKANEGENKKERNYL